MMLLVDEPFIIVSHHRPSPARFQVLRSTDTFIACACA
jgi:hypothetical protein